MSTPIRSPFRAARVMPRRRCAAAPTAAGVVRVPRLLLPPLPPLLLTLLASLIAGTPAWAQGDEVRWRIPERGAVCFEREQRITSEVLETTEEPRPGPNPSLHLFDWRQLNPPLLLQGELDRRQQVCSEPPRDLRVVAAFVALDLRSAERGGKLQYVVPRLLPFGDVHLTGKAAPPAADGTQTLTLRVQRREPDPLGERRDTFGKWIGEACNVDLGGTLEIVRHVDAGAGLVREFTAKLATTVTWPEGQPRRRARLDLHETWRLRDVRESRDAEFRAAVATAIERASDWLLQRIADPTTGDVHEKVNDGKTYNTGRLALALLALLHAEVPADHPIVQKGLDELRRREITDTYSLGLSLMALEASLAPRHERERLIADAGARPQPRQPSDADRALMREWVERLLTNCDQNVPTGQVRRWHYLPSAGFDNSNTQYALLGLWSAQLCGVEVPDKVWLGAAHHWLKEQQSVKGRDLDLQLTSYRDHERLERGEAVTQAQRRVQPAGWGYEGDGRPAYGSMTAAGVAALTLCEHVLEQRRASAALLRRIDGAIRDGFGWLAVHFSLRCNPGFAQQWHNRRYYYLYGVERACEFSRVALLQGRDWYYEGAMLLLAWQAKSGEFTGDVHSHTGGIDNTAFALLFLKKAALPVFTGNR